jgi:hypothetical protein
MNAGDLFTRPILVIGCSRSGTTLLFRNLAEHPLTWSLYEESRHIFYRHYPFHPQLGDRVAEPPSAAVARDMLGSLYREAHNKEFFRDRAILKHIPRKVLQRPLSRLYKRPPIRLVEKTPPNCIRVPLLAALFPDALCVYIVRRAESVISSLMEGWKIWSGGGRGGWSYTDWHYVAPPGWQEWTDRPLQEICAFQWIEANHIARRDLEEHYAGKFLMVRHETAMTRPQETYQEIREFCELPESEHYDRLVAEASERVFTHGGSTPRRGKWRELHEAEVESVRPMFQPLMDELYPEPPDLDA